MERKKRLLRMMIPGVAAALSFLCAGTAFAEKRNFELTIQTVNIQVSPQLTYTVFGFNGQVPGPLIHVKEGDEVTVKVTNMTELPHTIHWHGIYNSPDNDGVPAINQPEIKPGESFTYSWTAKPTGSLWYHCHVNVSEHIAFRGMWGPIIVDPQKPTEIEKTANKELIMMLSGYDSNYKDKPGYGGKPGEHADFFAVNAHSFAATQPIRVKKGDVVRMRFYGAGGEVHALHIHGHSFLVTHKDGYPLPAPYRCDTVLIGPGERYDVLVEMNNPGYWAFHDHVDTHATNNGVYPGGIISVVEYEGVKPKDFYPWKDIAYNNNYYYQDSIAKGVGLFEEQAFKGTPLERRRRGAAAADAAPATPPAPAAHDSAGH